MLFNESQKLQYIEEALQRNSVADKNIMQIFKSLCDLETKLNKDVSCFTANEIVGFYRCMFTSSFTRLRNINSQLKIYTSWCLNYNLVPDNQNHFEEISVDVLKTCLNKGLEENQIVTREELFKVLDQMNDIPEKIIFLGIFEGLGDNNLISLRESTRQNITDEGFIMKNGTVVNISNELRKMMLEAVNRQYYIANDQVRPYKDGSENYILKGKYNTTKPYLTYNSFNFFTRLYRFGDDKRDPIEGADCLAAKKLKVSGLIYRCKQIFASGKYATFRDLLDDNYDDLSKIYGNFQRQPYILLYSEYVEG